MPAEDCRLNQQGEVPDTDRKAVRFGLLVSQALAIPTYAVQVLQSLRRF